jgi:twitching motility protein PilU
MDNSSNYIQELLKKMVGANASDLFITVNFPPAFKVDGKIVPVSKVNLSVEQVRHLVTGIMNSKQQKEFHDTKECNFAIAYDGIGRFRVNCFVQQSHWGMVFRTIKTEIPKVEDMYNPKGYLLFINAQSCSFNNVAGNIIPSLLFVALSCKLYCI